MTADVLQRAIERGGWSELNAETIDAFIEDQGACVLFFAGDTSKRPEADDVAVILPELQKEFDGAFRVGVIRREDGEDLRKRFGAQLLPTLCLLHDGRHVVNIPRIQSWAEYRARFTAFLASPTEATTET